MPLPLSHGILGFFNGKFKFHFSPPGVTLLQNNFSEET